MNRGFDASFRRHLALEQRRAVLDALAEKIDPGTTLGQIVDIAAALGWADGVGGLSLSDLADALLTAEPGDEPPSAADEDDDADDDGDDDEVAALPAPTRGKKKAAPPGSAKSAKGGKAAKVKGRASARAEKPPEPARAEKAERAKPAAPSIPGPRPGRGKGKAGKITIDERMSLDEAAAVFLPLVRQLGRATMQDIEDATSGGRRKLRFHIGQLVKHGHLERHGMGRGTYYTLS